jgi:hypothetical protein
MEKKFEFLLNGWNVYSDPRMTMTEVDHVDLSWGERLFSWPWRPWKKTYKVVLTVASDKVILDEENRRLYAHPHAVMKMSQAIYDRINLPAAEENKDIA